MNIDLRTNNVFQAKVVSHGWHFFKFKFFHSSVRKYLLNKLVFCYYWKKHRKEQHSVEKLKQMLILSILFVNVCVCVCLCARERERERVCVSVCVRERVCVLCVCVVCERVCVLCVCVVCVCVCVSVFCVWVWVWEKEERWIDGDCMFRSALGLMTLIQSYIIVFFIRKKIIKRVLFTLNKCKSQSLKL